jgi:hypothetical protein
MLAKPVFHRHVEARKEGQVEIDFLADWGF